LCRNPNAIHLLEKHPEKEPIVAINWDILCENPNITESVSLLAKYPKQINWNILSKHPSLLDNIDVLDKFEDKQDYIHNYIHMLTNNKTLTGKQFNLLYLIED
jgi:hypothetical protein